MKGQIKAVLFDMDGVLVEAKDWHYEAFNKALEVFGMPISRSEHLSQYDGLPTRAKLAMLTEKKHLPVQLHAFLNNLKQSYTRESSPSGAALFSASNTRSRGSTMKATRSPCARTLFERPSK